MPLKPRSPDGGGIPERRLPGTWLTAIPNSKKAPKNKALDGVLLLEN
jgi:hypothetical protein